ncbi:unnamed protein product, partial [Symbiodinium sp. CCMP2456]
MTWLEDYAWEAMSPSDKQAADDKRRENRLHVGSHPDILLEYTNHENFVENARYVINNIKDAIEAGIQQVAVHTVCKMNRHRSVAGGILLFDIIRRLTDISISLTHMNAAYSWPFMGKHSCKGQCMHCQHKTADIVSHVAHICDAFARKVFDDGTVRENATLVVEPSTARPRGARTYSEIFNDQQIAAGNVQTPIQGVSLLDQPPRLGETATQAATRMGLAGKTHTQYVAKYNPDSLTGAMNRTVNEPKGYPIPSAVYVKDLTDANHMLESQNADLRDQLHETRRQRNEAWEELDEERRRADEERRRAERAEARIIQMRDERSSRRRRRSSSSDRDRH